MDRVNSPPFKRIAATDRKVPHHPPWRRRRHLRTALPWWQSRPPSDARALPCAAVVAAGARARLIHLVAGGLLGCRSASTRPDWIRWRPWRGAAHSCRIRRSSCGTRRCPCGIRRRRSWRDPPAPGRIRRPCGIRRRRSWGDPPSLLAGSRSPWRDPPAPPSSTSPHAGPSPPSDSFYLALWF